MKEESPNIVVFTTSNFPAPIFNPDNEFMEPTKIMISFCNRQKYPEMFNGHKTAYYNLMPEPFIIK